MRFSLSSPEKRAALIPVEPMAPRLEGYVGGGHKVRQAPRHDGNETVDVHARTLLSLGSTPSGGGDTVNGRTHVYPASRAALLDNWVRRLVHPPGRILRAYIRPGNVVLDIGCGSGFFARAMARMVGDAGRVIAVDLQEEMLRRVQESAKKEGLLPRIRLHTARADTLDLSARGCADFALAFYVVHEVPDAERLLQEIAALLVPGGRLLVVEPKGEVSATAFERMVQSAHSAGFRAAHRPKVLLSRAVVLRKVETR